MVRIAALAAASGALFGASPALAQTAAKPADDGTIEQVVITAQKRKEKLQDVPISATVINAEALEKSRVRTLMDLTQTVPNFEAAPLPGTSAITVRGVGGGGRNIGFDTRVGVYLDGIYVGQAQALGQPLFDIEQVEVLRGPQGHLFGRNTVAGAVNITTRAPTKDSEGSLRTVVGNHGAVEVYGTVSGAVSDSVLGKISIAKESRDGYTTNLFDGGKLDDLNRFTTRGQLRFLATDKLTFDLFADYSNTKADTIIGEPTTSFGDRPLPGGPLPSRVVNFNTKPFINVKLSGVSLTANYALAGGNTLTAVSGYRHTDQDRANDTDYNPQDIFRIRFQDDFKQNSLELRISSPVSGGVRYVGGVYLMKETADTLRRASSGADAGLLRLPTNLVATNAGTVTTKDAAVFGSLDVDLIGALTLNLGARYTNETKRLLYNLNGGAALGIATLVDFRDHRSENKVTPTVGLSYAASKDLNLYTKYSTGFKSGGWNADFVRASQVADGLDFDTETVKSYEAGMKGALLSGRMQYEVAAFTSHFNNYQTFFFVPLPNGTAILQLKNAAKVDSKGLEASMRVRVISDLRLGFGLGLVDTTYKSFPNGGGIGVDLSGQRVPDTPKLTASVTVDYTVAAPALGGSFNLFADYSHRNSAFLGSGLPDLGARNLTNLRLSYSPDSTKWSASLWARNVTNQNYVIASGRDFLGNNFVTRGVPRTFGAEAKYYF